MLSVITALTLVADAVMEGWPLSGIVLALAVLGKIGHRSIGRLTTLGSARWADIDDLRQAGMIGTSSGLILGRVAGRSQYRFGKAIKGLFRRDVSAAEACQDLVALRKRCKTPIVRLPNAIHTAVFSPSGGGKGVSCVIPYLLNSPESCVALDQKGELARLTADIRREKFGHKIVWLDPFKVVTQTPDSFDPLSAIDKNDPLAIDACNALAKALVLRTGDEKEPHWNDSAEAWIAAIIAMVVHYGSAGEGTRSLQTVREIFSSPQKLDMAIKLMIESEAWGGILARLGGQLTHFIDKERSSTLTTVSRHLRFLDSLAVVESTKRSSFDPAELRSGKMTIYLILPPDQMKSQSPLLRMWIGSMLRAVVSGGPQEQNIVRFVLDEAASLGHLEVIDDAVDKFRGYGVRLIFCYQSLGQLKKCFPDGQDQTLLSNCTQVFFGVNDQAIGTGGTADFISARLGDQTILVDSGGDGTSQSYQRSADNAQQTNRSFSSSRNRNWAPQARRLLKPEEVIALPPREAITFTPGVPPIRTTLLRYYEEPFLDARPSRLYRAYAALSTAALSVVTGTSLMWVAFALALFVHQGVNTRQGGPPARDSPEVSDLPAPSQATGDDVATAPQSAETPQNYQPDVPVK
jgi:type IV secretion system protein VirD4